MSHFIRELTILSDADRSAMLEVFETCREKESFTLSLPLDEPDTTFLLLNEGAADDAPGRLLSFLCICRLDEDLYELLPFTAPAERGQGYFDLLFDEANELLPETAELLFPADDQCLDGLKVLDAYEAECTAEELKMTLPADILSSRYTSVPLPEGITCSVKKEADGPLLFSFYCCDINTTVSDSAASSGLDSEVPETDDDSASLLLSASVFPSGEDTACIFEVEVPEALRGQGIAKKLFPTFLSKIHEEGYQNIILQVSADNEAAVRLYEGCRFCEETRIYTYTL